jgi:hypothetical protein
MSVAFITSDKDREVPRYKVLKYLEIILTFFWSIRASTEKLARELADRNENEVYLLVLKESSHPRYMMDSETDANTYQNFLHALYKRLNLPFIENYAQLGENLLEQAKLNPKKVMKLVST